jgi:hypothetical protein
MCGWGMLKTIAIAGHQMPRAGPQMQREEGIDSLANYIYAIYAIYRLRVAWLPPSAF